MIITTNKRAYFNYQIFETFEAGIELKGFEVKAIKNHKINLAGSYAIVRNNEVWLINADIPAYQPKNAPSDYNSKRTRRLLMKKSEIKGLIGRIQEKGLTLLPLIVYTKGRKNLIKVEIGLGKSRKKADKREVIREREAKREIKRNL